ncbi:MAG TPA: M20/M25/M40 family metallo-hydrolase [bacterium]|nr:M20/M25/M40 family metallo-hydrolase [bacterium]
MKKRICCLVATVCLTLVCVSLSTAQTTTIPMQGFEAISADTMYQHVAFLASDAMRGRNTPSEELDQCAEYIANYFETCGLQTVSTANGYYQNFPLLKTRLEGPENQSFIVTINGESFPQQIKNDFVPVYLTANRQVTAPVVFVGYSITAPELGYDDYQYMDVRDKIVLAFSHEPQENDSSSVFDGVKKTDHSKLVNKVLNAIDHGAVGFIYVTNPTRRFRRPPNVWPSLMKNVPEDAIPFTLGEKEENKIVVAQIGKKLAETLFSVSDRTMQQIHQQIDETLVPQSFELRGVTVTMNTQLEADEYQTQNVVGYLEGADPKLKQELIVIGGHYDHVGAADDTTIYNGADDNASGTAGVMAVARAFTACEQRPRRSILFMTFAGEEKGLFGSRYYVGTDPLFPLEQTVAMINLDMIGRNDTSAVSVYGWSRSPNLKQALLQANESVGISYKFADETRMSGGSDHMSFARKQIPYLFFITGMHEDYHKPTDTVEKIIPEKMAQIARLVFGIVWQIANSDERPQFVEPAH